MELSKYIFLTVCCVTLFQISLSKGESSLERIIDALRSLKSLFIGDSLSHTLKELEPLYYTVMQSRLPIDFQLYTKSNIQEACDMGRTEESLKKCLFNHNDETVIFLHGYNVVLKPTSVYYGMKDSLLDVGSYNVIIANYSGYTLDPILLGYVLNPLLIGRDIAKQVDLIITLTNASPSRIHLIGQSLGAHIAGFVGKNSNFRLGRITGLDPAGEVYRYLPESSRLTYTDADFVDIIHVSNVSTGLGHGIPFPIGHMDFYINGGDKQPNCEDNDPFQYTDGTNVTVNSNKTRKSCYHDSVQVYFLESIKCPLTAVQCDSYEKFKKGLCTSNNSMVSVMGMFTKQQDVPPKTKFYVNTDSIHYDCSNI